MSNEQRKEINTALQNAAANADLAMKELAEAAAFSARAFHFHLAKNILDKAIIANDLRAGALGTIQQEKA